MKRRLSSHLYRLSLASFIILLVVVLTAALYDIGQQLIDRRVYASGRRTKVGDILITGGAYALTIILAIFISSSRLISVKQILSSIPKAYVPIQKHDVAKPVQQLIAREYARSATIAHVSQPKSRRLKGWGEPGTVYEGIQFRAAILESANALETLLVAKLGEENLPPKQHTFFPTSKHPHPSPVSRFMPVLFPENESGQPSLLPKQLKLVLHLYDKRLQAARYEQEEPTQAEYEDCLRVIAVIAASLEKG